MTADGRDLVATGTVVHNGRRLAIATAEVVNADGDRVAIATGTTLLGSSPPPRAGADSIAEGADARIGR